MAQFLVITENSLSLQSSPIFRINRQRVSKGNYKLLLMTYCKYLFFRRVSFQKKLITFEFIEALRLECDMEHNLSILGCFPFSKLSYAVYHDTLAHLYNHEMYEKRPILFNLKTYEFSFYDEHFNISDDVSDLPY